MQITIEVPDRLGEQLQQLGDRLPEALIHALQELTSTETTTYQDDSQNSRLQEHTDSLISLLITILGGEPLN